MANSRINSCQTINPDKWFTLTVILMLFLFKSSFKLRSTKKQNKPQSLLIISGRTLPLSRLQCMGCNKLMAVKPGPQSCRQFLAKTTSGATSSKAPRSSSRPAPSSRFQTVILTAIYPRLGFSKIFCTCVVCYNFPSSMQHKLLPTPRQEIRECTLRFLISFLPSIFFITPLAKILREQIQNNQL